MKYHEMIRWTYETLVGPEEREVLQEVRDSEEATAIAQSLALTKNGPMYR